MAEIDPVVLELRAELGRYRSDIRSLTNEVTMRLGLQEASVKSLEDQFSRSSASIGSTVKGLAGTLGALFTGREVVAMVDSFTRLQNSLKVAGLEGQQLEGVQSSLLELSKRYGVGIEGLANLYGKATDAGRSFGASEAEILQLTEATSQALLITGTGAEQASGAILGLSQALASGTVRAEEYNQINEGGLRPLLQAAAASERFGGDINKLRAAMLDGKVTSQEFFAGILAGSAQLSGQAAKATLTLSGAYEALTSALTVYVGQSAQANGVTNALAGGLQALANNVDSLATVFAVLATFIGGRYVGALAASTAAALAAARANVILSVAATGAGTSLQVLSVRATLAGRALLAAFGGPVGLAVTGLTLVIGALSYAVRDTAASLEDLEAASASSKSTLEDARKQAKAAGIDIESLKKSTDGATSSFGGFNAMLWKSVDAMVAASKSAKNLAIAKLALSDAEAKQVLAERGPRVDAMDSAASRNRRFNAALGQKVTGFQDLTESDRASLDVDRARIAEANAILRDNKESRAIIEALPTYTPPSGNAGPSTTTAAGPKKTPRKGSGKSVADEERRAAQSAAQVQDELDRMNVEILRTRADMTRSAEDRAVAELGALKADRASYDRQLKLDDNLKAEDREQLMLRRDATDSEKRRAILFQASEDLAQERFDRESAANANEAEVVSARGRVKDRTSRQRKATDLRLIDLEFSQREDEATKEFNAATKRGDAVAADIARSKLARIELLKRLAQEEADIRNQTPLEAYVDAAPKNAAEISEALEGVAVDGLDRLNDGLTNAIVNSENLGAVFKNVAKSIIADLIRIAIQQQIVNALSGALGGGGFLGGLFGAGSGGSSLGGGLGSFVAGGKSFNVPSSGMGDVGKILGKSFGRASGGYVAPGQTVRVNEHRGGAEYLRMGGQGGTVVPLGQVNAQAARAGAQTGGGVTTVRLELSGDIDARIDQRSAAVSVEVVRATAPSVIQGAVQETQRQMSRPRMPGAGR